MGGGGGEDALDIGCRVDKNEVIIGQIQVGVDGKNQNYRMYIDREDTRMTFGIARKHLNPRSGDQPV